MNNGHSAVVFSLDTEIRHLRSSDRRYLAEVLDASDRWKDLAAILPKPDGEKGFLISSANVRKLEQQKTTQNGSPTQALLDYWGTKGRKRPVMRDLIQYLKECQFFVAAEYMSVNVVKGPSILNATENLASDSCSKNLGRHLITDLEEKSLNIVNHNSQIVPNLVSPTAPNLSALSIDDNNAFEELSELIGDSTEMVQFEYSKLVEATCGFSEKPLQLGGCKIGAGAFGSVYKASLPKFSDLAVKKIASEFIDQFLTELKVLRKFKHQNLLHLLGVSYEGDVLCLVYEFMVNGSLQDRIACTDGTSPLLWAKRLQITRQACDGICYLHTFDTKPYIHRDIKSANILLDQDFNAKVGDFGLTKVGSDGQNTTKTCVKTANIIGTSVYMAPEAFRGEVSVKIDTFSFGVVMLELLSGLPPFDAERDEADIISYVEESISDESETPSEADLKQVLDPKLDLKHYPCFLHYLKLAKMATEQRKKNRPTMLQMAEYLGDKQLEL